MKVYAGTTATGSPVQTLTTTRTGATWAVNGSTALVDGTYTVQATQTDAAGNSGTSNTRTFTVDTSPPAVTLTAPADGSRTNDTTPTYSGAAGNATGDSSLGDREHLRGRDRDRLAGADAHGDAQRRHVDGRRLAGAADGTYTAQATQTDTAGNTGTSTAQTFVIDTSAPAITLTAPAAGATFASGGIAFSGVGGTATGDGCVGDRAGLRGRNRDRLAGADAQHDARRRDRRLLGDRVAAAARRSVHRAGVAGRRGRQHRHEQHAHVHGQRPAGRDRHEPARQARCSATARRPSAVTAGHAADDLPTVTLKIYAGTTATGSPVQTLTDGGSGATWSVTAATLADGTYTVQASQTDSGAATGTSAARTFRIDATPPAVTLTAPADGSRTNDTTPAYSGAAGNATGDSASVTVKVYIGTTATGGTPCRRARRRAAAATWTVDGSPALAEGTYTAQATQADDGREHRHERGAHVHGRHDRAGGGDHGPGGRRADQRRDARHHRQRRHRRGRRGTVTLQPLRGGDTSRARRSRRSPRRWAVAAAGRSRPPTLAEGTYTVQATQTDTAGNTGTSTAKTFTVDTTPPAVTLTAPADGSRTNDTTPAYCGRGGQRDR